MTLRKFEKLKQWLTKLVISILHIENDNKIIKINLKNTELTRKYI